MKSKRFAGGKSRRVAGVESLVDVAGRAGDAKFPANVAGGAAAGHRVEHLARAEVTEQIA